MRAGRTTTQRLTFLKSIAVGGLFHRLQLSEMLSRLGWSNRSGLRANKRIAVSAN
jgi:hypothetical protein